VERYIRKYGDAAFVADLTKTIHAHDEAKSLFNAEVADSLRQIVEAVERYIKNESTRLVTVLEKLVAKVPEFKELGLGDVEERLAAVVKESEIVIEKLRARLDEMREDKATHLTLDEVFDLVKELNDLWDITSRFVKFYSSLYSDLSPLLLMTT
jgi:acyl transferase domain-containing protein